MRVVFLPALFVLLASVAVSAQTGDPVPDPTPPEQYYPLDVGNEWVYVDRDRGTAFREEVIGDTTVGGEPFAVVERTVIGSHDVDLPRDTARFLLRVDPDAAVVVTLGESGEAVTDGCPLDADFPAEGSADRPVACGETEAVVFGGPETYVPPGLFIGEGFEATAKGFLFADGTEVQYAAGVGRVYSYRSDIDAGEERLVYASTPEGEFGMVPVADPTDPAMYYPLDVGYVAESIRRLGGGDASRTRRTIERDTLIGGVRYVVERTSTVPSTLSGEIDDWGEGETRLLRFDTTSAQVMRWDGDRDSPATCPFDTAFNQIIGCKERRGVDGALISVPSIVLGAAGDGTVFVGDWWDGVENDPAPITAAKGFYGLQIGFADAGNPGGYGAGVGPLPQRDFAFCTLCREDITYLRLVDPAGSVREYGARYGVAADDAPRASALAVSAFPNPATGPLALALDVPTAATVTLDVFDALGRRVWQSEVVLGTGRQRVEVDAAGWAPGLYVVRATGPMGRATATVVRR